jgi:chemotaxis protein MotB
MKHMEDRAICLEIGQPKPGGHDFGVPLPEPMPKTTHWSVPWSDLMMTMFIFFAVLYFFQTNRRHVLSGEGESFTLQPSAQSAAQVQGAGSAFIPGTVNESLSNLYDFGKQTVEAKDLKDFASVDLVADKAVRIILTGDLLFDTGRAEIKAQARASLQDVAEIIRSTPYMLNVVGHTDDVPIQSAQFPTNWELSLVRASHVARFLIEEMKIPGERFFVTGHSYYQPVKPNTSARNRAANRRVEIIITKEKPVATGDGEIALVSPDGRSGKSMSPPYDRWPWNSF